MGKVSFDMGIDAVRGVLMGTQPLHCGSSSGQDPS